MEDKKNTFLSVLWRKESVRVSGNGINLRQEIAAKIIKLDTCMWVRDDIAGGGIAVLAI